MFKFFFTNRKRLIYISRKFFSTTIVASKKHCCKLLFVGGGDAGCATAAKFSKVLNKHEVIIVEPGDVHYYQSYFTFIGAGVKKVRDVVKPTMKVLPQNITWLQDSVEMFCPHKNTVILKSDDVVEYEIMVIALGVELDYHTVTGLKDALDNYRDVCTIYSPKYVEKTFKCFKEFVKGTVLFTAPNTPMKCYSASLQICLLAQDYFVKTDKISEADVTYITAMETLHPVDIYDEIIGIMAKKKRVDVHLRTNLVEVLPKSKQAVFECLKKPGNKITLDYSMLHVAPPMSPPEVLKSCKDLVNAQKYVDVDLYTLQHKKFQNIYAVGDCSPGMNNKSTNAAVHQSFVVFKNVVDTLYGKRPETKYLGYTCCPIITSYGKCMLTEFDYTMEPHATRPFNLNFGSTLLYYFKKYIIPYIYWHLLLSGILRGSELRDILHLDFGKIFNKLKFR